MDDQNNQSQLIDMDIKIDQTMRDQINLLKMKLKIVDDSELIKLGFSIIQRMVTAEDEGYDIFKTDKDLNILEKWTLKDED